jgi:hypothetical protein
MPAQITKEKRLAVVQQKLKDSGIDEDEEGMKSFVFEREDGGLSNESRYRLKRERNTPSYRSRVGRRLTALFRYRPADTGLRPPKPAVVIS